MIDTLIEILSPAASFAYLPEILGGLIIVYLLIRLRRRRRQSRIPGDSPAPAPEFIPSYLQEDQTDEYLDEGAETAPEDEEIAGWEEKDVSVISGDDITEDEIETTKIPEISARPPESTPGAVAAKEPEAPPSGGLFERLKTGLSKTRLNFARRFEGILAANRPMDDDALEAIEEALITADVGVPTTMELMGRISAQSHRITGPDTFKEHLRQEMRSFITLDQPVPPSVKPYVIMMVGVNGAGKTTTIGKLASRFSADGKKVLLAAADTFRAAAADQLSIWADRAGSEIVRHRDNADPAAVAYDGIEAAVSRGVDVVIVDTAGRLQTKVNLMEQLKKIKRSIDKALPGAPHEVMLVLDATTGQNAVSQAKLFDEGIGVTGIILAKLDGTAKGGIVISICHTLKIPIRYIGIGEGIDDLQEFDPERFIDALL